MTREEALQRLKSDHALERFEAARVLGSAACKQDVPELMAAKSVEADGFVRLWINRAILSCHAQESGVEKESAEHFEPVIYRKAVEWVTGVLVHEIGNKFGLVEYTAGREVSNYPDSKTAKLMADLASTLAAIEDLQSATKATSQEQFDLAAFVDETVEAEQFDQAVEVLAVGTRPLLVYGVPRLLKLALRNGLRNAVDASKDAQTIAKSRTLDTEHPSIPGVVISWGVTDIDCWISVIDSGIGLPNTDTLWFELGTSTKPRHSGFGLAIAKQAMDTMDGTIDLEPSSGGGAKFSLTWQRSQ